MEMDKKETGIVVGVLALQGAFNEHIQLLRKAISILQSQATSSETTRRWRIQEVRTVAELQSCDALIIPGGESTAISLVAQRSNMLEPLREFVKIARKPTWGTCAGLILLAESANRTKKGGQELIGGLDVRVNRNHFGRQIESFQADLNLPFLSSPTPFPAIFIRAPIVERLLPHVSGVQSAEAKVEETVVAPSRSLMGVGDVQIMGVLPGRAERLREKLEGVELRGEEGDIVAVRQANVFGTSFHPELTGDERIHVWWLERVSESVEGRSG
ncbi:hypothetical protein B7494_g742 [Chlorociboria aeruginascens]|nr:hypothetical protein B7494_g742 [Chlorociboria aeruginascens]